MKETVTRLVSLWGPPGHEQDVAAAIRGLVEPHVDEVRTDAMGNLLAIRVAARPGGKRVMLVAHMDTMGGMVVNIGENGLLSCAGAGGFTAHGALGHRALFGRGIRGVIQHEPIDDPKEIDLKRLWVDIGATSRAEAESLVALGDMFTVEAPAIDLGDRLVAPGLDNRAGCAVLVEVARHLQDPPHEVCLVFTAQGEVTTGGGPRGAQAAAFGVSPDLALVVDVSPVGDTPSAPKVETRVGIGPGLKLKDGQYIAHEGVKSLLLRVADENAIPLQREILPAGQGHSDAQVLVSSGQGIPTGVITIPARYKGTAGEMVSLRDMHGAVDLLLKVLGGPIAW